MDSIYYNGKIITMDHHCESEERLNTPEAILVRDGIIRAVGSYRHIAEIADQDAAKHDLMGKCLMPGFVDGHSHISMTGEMATWADLSDCSSFQDIVDTLKDYSRKNDLCEDDVILGFGYDHNFLEEKSHPEKDVLDRISTDIPVFIMHVTGHFGCVNTAALMKVNFNEDTVDPEGGVIVRYPGTRIPTGYLEETAMEFARKILVFDLERDERSVMSAMQETYLCNGITTVQDGETRERDFDLLKKMNDTGELKVDVVAYPTMMDKGEELLHKYEDYTLGYKGRLKIGGYKLILDGSPQGRTAWMSEPYLNGDPDYCGFPWVSDDEVERMLTAALSERRQVLAHCNGDAASEQFLRCYMKVMREVGDAEGLRPVMVHCQTVRNDQLDRMAEIGMIASIFIGHVWYWGDIHMVNFGPERGNHISPAADALKRGISVNFHQDTPITRPRMLHSVWCAVNRLSRNWNVIGADQKISVYDALKAVTINAAYSYFEENEKGSIAEGKKADLVILSDSPLDVPQMSIRDISVLETIKDGETIYSAN